ncbi:YciI family protein [Gloeobacter violaceus]|uniref:Gsl3977 protein n=1 Tax=Gloeobacter violaceus (strain ATCC 29082 / PCC 7421) TaxID=251221 RepID=Q7NEA3_GLOVI|nr:YciI family protein [Gloeobacter violaceus]BAC91918.1 gsl3977 [Gloeobacter violaceus PCC 7421]
MQYMIMTYEEPAAFEARTDAQKSQAYWGSWAAYAQTLKESGVMVGGNGLQPPHAGTTLRLQNGQRQIQDGPGDWPSRPRRTPSGTSSRTTG